MNIAEEDKSNFVDKGDEYTYYSKIIKEYLPDAVILVSRCAGIPCSKCVGRKHNVRYGCPVCGVKPVDRADESLYRCKWCGSVIRSCGGGNILAIGVPRIWLELREDII